MVFNRNLYLQRLIVRVTIIFYKIAPSLAYGHFFLYLCAQIAISELH